MTGPELKRPTSVTVCAIINFVIYAPLGLCGLIGAFFRKPSPLDDIGLVHFWQLVSTPIGAIATIALVIGSIGLLSGARWGRTLTIAWAVWGIIGALVGIFIALAYVLPNFEQLMPPDAPAAAAAFGKAIMFVTLLVTAVYPPILLWVMQRPHVVRFFDGMAPDAPAAPPAI